MVKRAGGRPALRKKSGRLGKRGKGSQAEGVFKQHRDGCGDGCELAGSKD